MFQIHVACFSPFDLVISKSKIIETFTTQGSSRCIEYQVHDCHAKGSPMSSENGLLFKNNKKRKLYSMHFFFCMQSFFGSVKFKNFKIYSGWLSMQTF